MAHHATRQDTTYGPVNGNRGVVAGHASGYAQVIGEQNHHYYGPSAPKSPPTPSCFVPFQRDPDFVEHGAFLEDIHHKLSKPASRVAIVGLGGIGKSQLVIEYCHRTAQASPETWVFWVHASNPTRIEQGFRNIAEHIKLSGRNDHNADIFKLVRNWLLDRRRKWLLVLDNADDPDVFSSLLDKDEDSPRFDLREHLPITENSSVLITSRTQSAARCLADDSDIISIQPMQEEFAKALLSKKLGPDLQDNSIPELAKALEYMPLAIVQAAAYIRRRAPRCTVEQYLREFNTNEFAKTSLLNRDEGDLRRDKEAKNSIIVTWQISFEHLRIVRPSAAELLSLMSFCDNQGIPEFLVRPRDIKQRQKQEHVKRTVVTQSDQIGHYFRDRDFYDNVFEDDVRTLREYSFLSTTTNAHVFEMHSLVQFATRRWLDAQNKAKKWRDQFVHRLATKFPNGDFETWPTCQALYPHGKIAMGIPPSHGVGRAQWSSLLHRMANYALTRGYLNEAQDLGTQSLIVSTELLDTFVEPADVLRTIILMSVVWRAKGLMQKVEELSTQTVEVSKKLLGEDSVLTLDILHVLGTVLNQQGKWSEAESALERALKKMSIVLGQDHPQTMNAANSLAYTYASQKSYRKAEQLYISTVEGCRSYFGTEHSLTLGFMHNLALLYHSTGQLTNAEELIVQVVEKTKKILGLEHFKTLTSQNNLARIYSSQGRFDEARDLHELVFKQSERTLGIDNPNTLRSMKNLAFTYGKQGKWREAEALHCQIWNIQQRVLGEDHPDTLRSMNDLAFIYREQGKWREAESLHCQTWNIQQRVLGEDHPDTLISMDSLAFTHGKQEKLQEAEALHREVLERSRKVLGPDHEDTLKYMNHLAYILHSQGRRSKGIALMKEVFQKGEKVLGLQHPTVQNASMWLDEWKASSLSQGSDSGGSRLV